MGDTDVHDGFTSRRGGGDLVVSKFRGASEVGESNSSGHYDSPNLAMSSLASEYFAYLFSNAAVTARFGSVTAHRCGMFSSLRKFSTTSGAHVRRRVLYIWATPYF